VAPRDVVYIAASGREANGTPQETGPRIWNRTDAEEGAGTVIVMFPDGGAPPLVEAWSPPEREND